MSDLRDHSQPCGHGFPRQAYRSVYGHFLCQVKSCPGGREVTDDDSRAMLDDLAKEMDQPMEDDDG